MSTSKTPAERYAEKLRPRPDGCTEWAAKIDKYGNAQFTWTDDAGIHRWGSAINWSWRQSRGTVPEGVRLRNTCGLLSCQTLDHWRLKPHSSTASPQEKYEVRVDRSGGPDACHPWTEGLDADGYPIFTFTDPDSNELRTVRAQRWAWDQAHPDNTLTKDTLVCHVCDTPPCCNEKHWFKDTHEGNAADMVAKGRSTGPGRGEKHHATFLTQEFVDMIRAEYEAAGRAYGMQTALANKYGLNRRSLACILSGRTWVPGSECKEKEPRRFEGKKDQQFIFDRDDGICKLCFCPVDPEIPYRDPETGEINLMSKSIDHIIPLARGGSHTLDNVQLAHFGCNKSKSTKVTHDPAP